MATLNDVTVPFEILRNPPPVIRGGAIGKSGTIWFYMELNAVPSFLNTISGTLQTIPLPGGGTVQRVVPLIHPDIPNMFCTEYESIPTGGPGPIGASFVSGMFSHAKVRCEFMTLPFAIGTDQPWYTLTVDAGTSIVTLPDEAFAFTDGEEVTGEAGLPIPIVNYNLTTYMSTTPINFTQAMLSGRVNSVEFDGFPPGYLRYTGTRSEYSKSSFASSLVKSYSLAFRPFLWNATMRRSGEWDIPVTSGGYLKYLTGDLNYLKY